MANKIIMTDGSKTETIYQVKGLNPFTDETPGVWSSDPMDSKKSARSARLVPSVYAGIATRMQAMMDMPFTIYGKGDAVIDDSDNYKNALGFMPDPARVFGLSEASLTTSGCAYWFKATGTRTGKVKELKYWIPSSVTLDTELAKKGVIKFNRTGVNTLFDSTQVFYNWLYDESVELGAPTVYPLASAMTAAEANGAITGWVRDYMARGAIKAMLLAIDGAPPPGEVERIESWWNRFMAGTKGMMWKVFNMSNIKPTIVGDGLEALKDLSINKELRYEIHTALGTRHLLEDENFATAGARERQFYTQVIVPDARLLQQNFNDQILHADGYHLEFEPERMELFQVDEKEQAQAFGDLLKVFSEVLPHPIAFQLASEKLDYQFTDEQKALIEKGMKEKEAKAKEITAQTQAKPEPVQPEPVAPMPKALIELDKWEKKVAKAGKMVTWHAVELSPEMVKSITDGVLSFDQARAEIAGRPDKPNDAALVLEGIRLALAKL